MIEIKNVQTMDGRKIDYEVKGEDRVIDGSGLVLIPALIDPHVHFRTPGLEHKENWETGAKAAIYGGITTVFDMPNTIPPTITLETLKEKKKLIDQQLKAVDIPLRYGLFFGADKNHFDEIPKVKDQIIGIKIYMGASTGGLVMDDDQSLETVFKLAAAHDLVLAIHAEDEKMIQEREKKYHAHGEIRSREVAISATKKALALAKMNKTRLYLVHITTKEEIELIAQAKKEGVTVFAETTPHHLFLNVETSKEQVNPPIRTKEDNVALWEAVKSGMIDTIGSDHAPHTREEKKSGKIPSGVPGVETTLPMLLNGGLSLNDIVRLMRDNVEKIFRFPKNDDVVLIDLNKLAKVDHLKTKCGWSPFEGRLLKGWPVYTILKGRVYELVS